MATVSLPAVELPPHVVDIEQLVAETRSKHGNFPQLDVAVKLMRNTTVQTRHTVLPFDELVDPPHLGERTRIYLREAVNLAAAAGSAAMVNADVRPADVSALIVVSCTGHALPGVDAHLVNSLGLPRTVRRIPIMQMGCGEVLMHWHAPLTMLQPIRARTS